jgi:hypothetical protein
MKFCRRQNRKQGVRKMKNLKVNAKRRSLSVIMIAIIAVNAFSFAACNKGGGGIGGGGSFELTGIPAESNGKYAVVYAAKLDASLVLVGVKAVNKSAKSVTLPRISNGSVSVPMWKVEKDGEMTRYSGNDTLDMVVVAINDSEKLDNTDPKDILADLSGTVPFIGSTKFSNGSAAKDWNSGLGGGMFGDMLKGLGL